MNKVKIKSLLTRIKNTVSIEDTKTYKRVTIKTKNKGIYLRDNKIGREIGTKNQFIINEGQFLLSKIDARNGAFGIVPKELDNAIITGNFWTYEVNKDLLNIEWFNLFVSSPNFIKICSNASSGTTNRQYLNEEFFLNYEIDLPSLDEQQKIIYNYKLSSSKQHDINVLLNTQSDIITKLRASIITEAITGKLIFNSNESNNSSLLLDKIKLEKNNLIKNKVIKKNKEIMPINKSEIPFEIPKHWSWARLGDVVTFADNLNIHSKLDKDDIINYVDIDAIDNKNYKIKECKVAKVKELSSRARRVLDNGYIVYSLVRPYLNNIAIITDTKKNYIGSTGLVVFKGIHMNDKYIFYVLLSDYIRDYYLSLIKGFNSPSITQGDFVNTLIPIPPLEEQNYIVHKIEKIMLLCNELSNKIELSYEYNENLKVSLMTKYV